MRHQSDCRAGNRIVHGNGFEQIEHCWSHNLDSRIRISMNAHNTEEEDQDSYFTHLVQNAEDKDDECNEGEGDEGEDEKSEDESS